MEAAATKSRDATLQAVIEDLNHLLRDQEKLRRVEERLEQYVEQQQPPLLGKRSWGELTQEILGDQSLPAILLSIAIQHSETPVRQEALRLIQRFKFEKNDSTEVIDSSLWVFARHLVAIKDEKVLACVLTTALSVSTQIWGEIGHQSEWLDAFLCSEDGSVREIALRTMIAVGGWAMLERVTVFCHPEDVDVLADAMKALPSRLRRLEDLSPSGFEHLIGHLLRAEYREHHVAVVGRQFDRGVDVIVYEGTPVLLGEWPGMVKYVVQCKRWKGKVPNRAVKELLISALERGADAIFAASNTYQNEEFVADLPELKVCERSVADPGRAGKTIRVDASVVRRWRSEEGMAPLLPDSHRDGRSWINLRVIDRAAIQTMMGEMAAGYDFGP